jgi:hypothetical protein
MLPVLRLGVATKQKTLARTTEASQNGMRCLVENAYEPLQVILSVLSSGDQRHFTVC